MSNVYIRHPHIHDNEVVFVAEDDLWVVAAEGGRAYRLTARPTNSSELPPP